jgi:hypothetical protein
MKHISQTQVAFSSTGPEPHANHFSNKASSIHISVGPLAQQISLPGGTIEVGQKNLNVESSSDSLGIKNLQDFKAKKAFSNRFNTIQKKRPYDGTIESRRRLELRQKIE